MSPSNSHLKLNFALLLLFHSGVVQLSAQSPSPVMALDYMPPNHAAIVDDQIPDAEQLSGGVRFKEMQPGKGPSIKPGDTVTALYIGRLLDGTIFNQKRSRTHTFEFVVGAQPRQIIMGWEIAMPLMQDGGNYKIAIPSQFAYREKGRENQVPPYATVIFEIEILSVKRA